MEESKRKKMKIESGKRAATFEVRIRNHLKNNLLEECVKEIDSGRVTAKRKTKRIKYFERNGWGQEESLELNKLRKMIPNFNKNSLHRLSYFAAKPRCSSAVFARRSALCVSPF